MIQNVLGAVVLGAGLAAVAAGLWMAYRGRTWPVDVERFEDVPETTVDGLEPGRVSLSGTVREAHDTSPVTGPLSGERGVAVESQVARGRRRLRIEDRQADWTPFELDDGTGRVRVELPDDLAAEGRSLRAGGSAARWCWGLSYDLVEKVRAGLTWGAADPEAARNLDAPFDLEFGADAMPPGQVRTYRERVVRPGDEVVVFGEARRSDEGWDAPDWTITADGHEGFLVSDQFATPEGRDEARRERTWSKRLGYGMGAFALVFGLAITAFGTVVSADPLVAGLYLLAALPFLGAGALVVRRGASPVASVDFAWRSVVGGAALGLGLAAGGGYLLATREGGTLPTVDAWPAYALLALGAFFLWGAVSAFLYAAYGVDLPMRGTIPGAE